MDDDVFRGFACPQVGLNPALTELLVVDHTRLVVKEFLERNRAELAARAPGTDAVLESWGAADGGFDVAWHPAFGDAHAAVLGGAVDPVRCACALALRLAEAGHTGRWRADLAEPARLRFGGRLLPATRTIRVTAEPDAVTIDTDGAGTVDLRRREAGWHTDQVPALPVLRRGPLRVTLSTPLVLSPAAADRLLHADAYTFGVEDSAAGGADWTATCRAAIDLIADAAPVYLPWVATVLRELIALRARPGTFNSGSERFSPGVVCVSDQPYVWPLAEMLVHEATHQYLNILTRLGGLDDGSDEGRYFSPFRNKDRPIFFIVVAYHAFGNVLLFYRTARENGFLPSGMPAAEDFADRERTLRRQLGEIEPVLRRATSLTAFGRALWEPVSDQIHR
ncbi:HEXXH motif-containing putative peptide modification protein [Pseudonocardia hispaniensis]|uniref:HEXXH motif-containing putative peptide modification protein n=1 Tax=Pseudonocardia hispaniensis TaxID=904933 RepID=A0ABW1J029_9PSEU